MQIPTTTTSTIFLFIMAAHFTEDEDCIILTEVLAAPPCDAKHGQAQNAWEEIAKRASSTAKRVMETRSVRERVASLIKNFKQKDAAELRASGILDTPSDRDNMLQEYIEYCEEAKKQKEQKASDTVAEARQVKDMALKRYRDKSRVDLDEDEDESIGSFETLSSNRRLSTPKSMATCRSRSKST